MLKIFEKEKKQSKRLPGQLKKERKVLKKYCTNSTLYFRQKVRNVLVEAKITETSHPKKKQMFVKKDTSLVNNI
jgi:hypothetical protein